MDVQGDLYDKNLYAYCDNNPVIRADDGGEFWHVVIGSAVGAVVGGVAKMAANIATGEDVFKGVGLAMGAGALSGALASTGLGAVYQFAGNALISGAESFVGQGMDKGFDNINYGEVAFDATVGGALGASGGISKGDARHLTKQGINATKRVTNTLSKSGVKAAVKETKKAAKYYASQTYMMYYRPMVRRSFSDIGKSAGVNIVVSHSRSAYARYW